MGLEIQKKKDGSLKSNWWYGRFEVDGKNHCVNLGVEIKGRVPKTLRKQGDLAFECSRTLAAAKLKELITEATSTKVAEERLQELYELKAGEAIDQIAIEEIDNKRFILPARKKKIPGTGKTSTECPEKLSRIHSAKLSGSKAYLSNH